MMSKDWILQQYIKENHIENGKVVMSEEYLKKRKMCCGNGCRNCPFWPEHQKGNTILKKGLE